jgi:hypothetical protein
MVQSKERCVSLCQCHSTMKLIAQDVEASYAYFYQNAAEQMPVQQDPKLVSSCQIIHPWTLSSPVFLLPSMFLKLSFLLTRRLPDAAAGRGRHRRSPDAAAGCRMPPTVAGHRRRSPSAVAFCGRQLTPSPLFDSFCCRLMFPVADSPCCRCRCLVQWTALAATACWYSFW